MGLFLGLFQQISFSTYSHHRRLQQVLVSLTKIQPFFFFFYFISHDFIDPAHKDIPGVFSWGPNRHPAQKQLILILIQLESSTSEPAEDFIGFKKTRDFGDFQVLGGIISNYQVLGGIISSYQVLGGIISKLCHRFRESVFSLWPLPLLSQVFSDSPRRLEDSPARRWNSSLERSEPNSFLSNLLLQSKNLWKPAVASLVNKTGLSDFENQQIWMASCSYVTFLKRPAVSSSKCYHPVEGNSCDDDGGCQWGPLNQLSVCPPSPQS